MEIISQECTIEGKTYQRTTLTRPDGSRAAVHRVLVDGKHWSVLLQARHRRIVSRIEARLGPAI